MEPRHLTFEQHRVSWYSAGPDDARVTVLWHHGTPNTGEPPRALVDLAASHGVRIVSFDRPGYRESEDAGPRSVSDGARLARAVLDEAGAGRVVALGYSGGGPYALASAAAMPVRVERVALFASLAPFRVDPADPRGLGLRWWRGMHGPGLGEVIAALRGGPALRRHLREPDVDPPMFIDRDIAALDGRWHDFRGTASRAVETGVEGVLADDLSFISPWGVPVSRVTQPCLVVHGASDLVVPERHARWLSHALPDASLTVRDGDGHLSVLDGLDDAFSWLLRAD
ncbi:alpha/beta fold hydrolase [Demequina sp. NBRC 110052]|uniref:alpha/beta fold hydrolase n=1 Tax=Demequina sp. NBRC 110052 TaxID=1570341 RepID=UPI0013565247|nr:alpha/beta hydrolase [Demequina sp. NBRC 110052]